MDATKFTVLVKIEVLSMDSVPSLLIKASERIGDECPKGQLSFEDGDCVEWEAEAKTVKF